LAGHTPGSSDTRSTWGFATTNEAGERIFFRDGIGGGGGGRPNVDGSDALNGNVAGRNRPAEFVENFYPIVVEHDRLARDSGGPGEHRGGHGCSLLVRFTAPGVLHIIDDRMRTQPWGVAGGKAGAGTSYTLNPGTSEERRFLHKIDAFPIKPGDRLLATTCGGGGWGDPLARPVDRVAEDVAVGRVSPQCAKSDYCVILDAQGNVDIDASAEQRRSAIAQRKTGALFDRGTRYADLTAEGLVAWTVPE
jgi:N-methylhydantoinase B